MSTERDNREGLRWYVSHIFMKPETFKERDRVLLDAVKPAVEALEVRKLIQTFHFLFEPDYEILFRVRLSDGARMNDVKAIVDEKLEPIKDLCVKIAPDEGYPGEGDPTASWSFGTEGWPLTEKFLEYGSRVALLIREVSMRRKPLSAGRLDSQFNIEKLVHCFLNQAGLSTIGEADFHIDRFVERSLMARGYYDALERLKKIEEKLTKQEPSNHPQQNP
jgi:hypothetical protein